MRSSYFTKVGSTIEKPGKRQFGACAKKHRWVSECTLTVQPGTETPTWMGSHGWESGEPYPRNKTVAIKIHVDHCPECGLLGRFKALDATFNEDKKCDARCTNARGHKCDCSCGGAHHGKAHVL